MLSKSLAKLAKLIIVFAGIAKYFKNSTDLGNFHLETCFLTNLQTNKSISSQVVLLLKQVFEIDSLFEGNFLIALIIPFSIGLK